MPRYIALLRGINVGGKNKISMKELKELFEENGCKDVVTYINSGNIIFSRDSENDSGNNENVESLKKRCEAFITRRYGMELPVMVVTDIELLDVLDNAPEWWDADRDSKHNALFIIPPITVEDVFREVGEPRTEYEKVASHGRVIFWSAPLKTFSRTRWSRIVEKQIYDNVTIRNSNTVKALARLCRGGD
ncbi:MAG TPA: DUF1697 domain-containing protein [Clostridiaceae bacterium]|nr:DUF1697 domain-containing protein [Clostridiaceae bacterium]